MAKCQSCRFSEFQNRRVPEADRTSRKSKHAAVRGPAMEKQQEEQHQSPKFPLPPVDSYHGSGVGSFVRHTAFTYTNVYLKACRSLLLKFCWFLQYFCWSSWSSNAFHTPTLLLAYKFYWYLQYFGKSRWSSKAFLTPTLLQVYKFYWY